MRNPLNAAAVLGRVALALIFVLSGAGKLAAQEATLGYIASSGLPFPVVALWGAIAMELVGGLALAAGFHARLAAIALAGFSLVTALVFHAEFSDQNQMDSLPKEHRHRRRDASGCRLRRRIGLDRRPSRRARAARSSG